MRALPYAVTTFVGAFLLFEIQLILAKAILPWFGGTPAVWTTCLVFFQVLLTAGYLYAHGSIALLRPRAQAFVHVALVVLSLAALGLCAARWGVPLLPDASWKPLDGDHPVRDILLLLAAAAALPYLALSSTSPLIQAWFARAFPGRSPLRLYALSNTGSLLGLVGYPVLIEPAVGVRAQALAWGALFVVFAACSVVCALQARATPPLPADGDDAPRPGLLRCVYWVLLAGAGTMLLMATSNHVCQEISTSPLLWMLPLAVYLLTFILCFDREGSYSPPVFSVLFGICMLVNVWLLEEAALHDARLVVGGSLLSLFVGCMICHGELVRSKPTPRHLTLFYLMLSVGGALGGLFVSLGAPLLFTGFWEMQVSQIAVALLLLAALLRDRDSWLYGRHPADPLLLAVAIGVQGLRGLLQRPEGTIALVAHLLGILVATTVGAVVVLAVSRRAGLGLHRRGRAVTTVAAVTAIATYGAALLTTARPFGWAHIAYAERNFYGVLRVLDVERFRLLAHGGTFHGWQMRDDPATPLGYYGKGSGVHTIVEQMQAVRPSLTVGVVGLGAGALAALMRPADVMTFYEIDPHVIDVAAGPDARFDFVGRSRGRIGVVRGDARLSLEREPRRFDLLVLDAFSSDAIPVHLLTREAFDTYVAHLAPGGVLALHISNRYLDLVPLVRRQCEDQGLRTVFVFREATDVTHAPSTWAVATADAAFLARPAMQAAVTADVERPPARRAWTDDWSNVWEMLR